MKQMERYRCDELRAIPGEISSIYSHVQEFEGGKLSRGDRIIRRGCDFENARIDFTNKENTVWDANLQLPEVKDILEARSRHSGARAACASIQPPVVSKMKGGSARHFRPGALSGGVYRCGIMAPVEYVVETMANSLEFLGF
jgi:hypothetical protein